jgi:putative peptidoglycan binding protein/LysM domain-containing protein
MSIHHVVQQGDCISSIAARYRLHWQTLWDHPDNQKLKEKRKHPGILHPGDVVVVPQRALKRQQAASNRRHQFVARTAETKICLRMTCNDQPIKSEPYRLVADGGVTREGSTDGDGKIEVTVPASVGVVKLTLARRNEEHEIVLGRLGPVDTVVGLQTRLHQLGFFPAEPDGQAGPLLTSSLKAFQRSKQLTESGEADDPTRHALADAFAH